MSYGTELARESLIDSEMFYIQVKQMLEILETELLLRKHGKHLSGFWKTKDGQKIPYSEMTETHLKNSIRRFSEMLG